MVQFIKDLIYWNWTVHRLPLEERMDIVKEVVQSRKESGRANALYMVAAVELGWEDVASEYCDRYFREKVEALI